jgi:hypothetical protein
MQAGKIKVGSEYAATRHYGNIQHVRVMEHSVSHGWGRNAKAINKYECIVVTDGQEEVVSTRKYEAREFVSTWDEYMQANGARIAKQNEDARPGRLSDARVALYSDQACEGGDFTGWRVELDGKTVATFVAVPEYEMSQSARDTVYRLRLALRQAAKIGSHA